MEHPLAERKAVSWNLSLFKYISGFIWFVNWLESELLFSPSLSTTAFKACGNILLGDNSADATIQEQKRTIVDFIDHLI